MLKTLLRNWMGGRTRTGPMGPSAPMRTTFTDATVERLRTLQQEHREATRSLAQKQPAWTALESRGDPVAHLERARLAPEIIDLQAQVQRVSGDITAAERTIEANKTLFAEGLRLVDDTQPWLAALLERLPTDSDLQRGYAESRRYNRIASHLLAGTGDRRFRRAAIAFADPYDALHTALTERLHALDRLRLLRPSALPLDKKAAS